MTPQEIEGKYNKNFSALKEFEVILRAQEATYDVHLSRLTSLKSLADSCSQLKKMELEFLKFSQVQADAQAQISSLKSQLAQQDAASKAEIEILKSKILELKNSQQQPEAPVELPAEIAEVVKKVTRKKAE